MGLDIRAYRQLRPVTGEHTFDDDTCWVAGHFHPWGEDRPERMEGLTVQCYTPVEKYFHFRAGSYSGYNEWRDQLSLMAQGRPARDVWEDPSGPFVELIDFSDCDGTIGPVVAAKLLEDFRAYQEKAKRWAEDSWFYSAYKDWMKAFEIAADGGAVEFC